MEALLRYWLKWPMIESFLKAYAWAWPLMEVMHFVGLCLLLGIVGMFDLRLLGFAKAIPVQALNRLVPWGVFGFVLCVISGLAFTLGISANVGVHPYTVLVNDVYLQWKLAFIALAGLNLFVFYVSGAAREAETVQAGQDAPFRVKVIAGASIFLWVGVMYFGRLIPWGSFGE